MKTCISPAKCMVSIVLLNEASNTFLLLIYGYIALPFLQFMLYYPKLVHQIISKVYFGSANNDINSAI